MLARRCESGGGAVSVRKALRLPTPAFIRGLLPSPVPSLCLTFRIFWVSVLLTPFHSSNGSTRSQPGVRRAVLPQAQRRCDRLRTDRVVSVTFHLQGSDVGRNASFIPRCPKIKQMSSYSIYSITIYCVNALLLALLVLASDSRSAIRLAQTPPVALISSMFTLTGKKPKTRQDPISKRETNLNIQADLSSSNLGPLSDAERNRLFRFLYAHAKFPGSHL